MGIDLDPNLDSATSNKARQRTRTKVVRTTANSSTASTAKQTTVGTTNVARVRSKQVKIKLCKRWCCGPNADDLACSTGTQSLNVGKSGDWPSQSARGGLGGLALSLLPDRSSINISSPYETRKVKCYLSRTGSLSSLLVYLTITSFFQEYLETNL